MEAECTNNDQRPTTNDEIPGPSSVTPVSIFQEQLNELKTNIQTINEYSMEHEAILKKITSAKRVTLNTVNDEVIELQDKISQIHDEQVSQNEKMEQILTILKQFK